MNKRPPMIIMIKFDPPIGVEFNEIREYITTELECAGGNRHPDDPLFHSLQNVHISKPITTWRDPKRKKSAKIHSIKTKDHQ